MYTTTLDFSVPVHMFGNFSSFQNSIKKANCVVYEHRAINAIPFHPTVSPSLASKFLHPSVSFVDEASKHAIINILLCTKQTCLLFIYYSNKQLTAEIEGVFRSERDRQPLISETQTCHEPQTEHARTDPSSSSVQNARHDTGARCLSCTHRHKDGDGAR
jgi:hypothetical protein